MNTTKDHSNAIMLNLGIGEDGFEFATDIVSATERAKLELDDIERDISESLEVLKKLTPECDKTDYILAASCGAMSGLFDIFLVGKPNESLVGDKVDSWVAERTKDFAKMSGWDEKNTNGTLKSAIRFLENKYKIPYDQRGLGDAGKEIFELNANNHHFKSLGHNPTICGLVFSILDQFGNKKGSTSHFVTVGELISLEQADDGFVLRGNDVPSKIFCGFVNWLGHLMSDVSGASGSKGRGMGIPSPLWCWSNDIIAIKKSLNIQTSEFDKSFNEMALNIYTEGYDVRFQAAQAIPVFLNEVIVRSVYSIRRLIQYYTNVPKGERNFKGMWDTCEPFKNASVKRMLTVAHGTFCLMDAGDATVRAFMAGGGAFNAEEFFLRLNIVGVGRFVVSLKGEIKSGVERAKNKEEVYFLQREKIVVLDYLEGLKYLSSIYDDLQLLTFASDFEKSDAYKEAFAKTVVLAEMRKVPEEQILKDKADIDAYFGGKK